MYKNSEDSSLQVSAEQDLSTTRSSAPLTPEKNRINVSHRLILINIDCFHSIIISAYFNNLCIKYVNTNLSIVLLRIATVNHLTFKQF